MPGPGPPQNRERGGCSASEPLSRDRRDIGSGSGRGTAAASRFKHGDVIVCATTACLRARLRTAPIRSRERQRADAQSLMTFCLCRRLGRFCIPHHHACALASTAWRSRASSASVMRTVAILLIIAALRPLWLRRRTASNFAAPTPGRSCRSKAYRRQGRLPSRRDPTGAVSTSMFAWEEDNEEEKTL